MIPCYLPFNTEHSLFLTYLLVFYFTKNIITLPRNVLASSIIAYRWLAWLIRVFDKARSRVQMEMFI